MRIFLHLLLLLVLYSTLSAGQVYGQDGGDGVSGAGNDNTDYSDSSCCDSSGGDSGDNGGEQQSTPSETETSGTDGGDVSGGEVSQADVDQAQAAQTDAWNELQAIENGLSDGDWDQALQDYLEASAYADSISAEFSAQQEAAAQETAAQQSMQDTISGTGINDINNGATVQDVATQHLDPALSPDRAAAVMGEWAAAYASLHGLDAMEVAKSPEFQATWSAHVGLSVQAGTVSADQTGAALAGGMSIATQTAGGNVQQMAEAAGQAGGLAAYAATINSIEGQLEAKTAAEMITDYGIRTGASVAEIAAAQRVAGIDPSTAHAAVQAGFNNYSMETRGTPADERGINHQFNNGYYSGAAPTATVNGIPTGAPAVASAGVAPGPNTPAAASTATGAAGPGTSGDFASQAQDKLESVREAPAAEREAAIGGIVRDAINMGMTSDQLGSILHGHNVTAADVRTAVNNVTGVSYQFNGNASTAQSYINNVVNQMASLAGQTAEVRSITPVVSNPAPAAQPADPVSSNDNKVGDIDTKAPAAQYTGTTGATMQDDRVSGGGTLVNQPGTAGTSNISWNVNYSGSAGEGGTPTGQLTVTYTENGKPGSVSYDYSLSSLSPAQVSAGLSEVNSASALDSFIDSNGLQGQRK